MSLFRRKHKAVDPRVQAARDALDAATLAIRTTRKRLESEGDNFDPWERELGADRPPYAPDGEEPSK